MECGVLFRFDRILLIFWPFFLGGGGGLRDADRPGLRVLRLLEGPGHQRHVGPQLYVAGRRPRLPRVLRT